jgi:DNA-binding transcriptional ArsR family regulator
VTRHVFDALADPNRRALMDALAELGTATPTQLASDLPVTRQAVSKHLATLEAAGLVASERRGRETHYRLTPQPLTEAIGWIAQVGSEWDDRLRSLDAYLRSDRG